MKQHLPSSQSWNRLPLSSRLPCYPLDGVTFREKFGYTPLTFGGIRHAEGIIGGLSRRLSQADSCIRGEVRYEADEVQLLFRQPLLLVRAS